MMGFFFIENPESLTKDSSTITEEASPTGLRRWKSNNDMMVVLASRFQAAYVAATEYITV